MTNAEPGSNESPQIVVSYETKLSPFAAQTLAALQQAVAEALDRKRRLGQYAIFWQDGRVVRVEAKDLPSLP